MHVEECIWIVGQHDVEKAQADAREDAQNEARPSLERSCLLSWRRRRHRPVPANIEAVGAIFNSILLKVKLHRQERK